MNRRGFLGRSGLASLAPLTSAQAQEKPKSLLITSASSRLAQSLADGLRDRYAIRLTERVPVRTDHQFVHCELSHDRSTQLAVQGVRAIVHVAEPLAGASGGQQVDYQTRCTYNLLTAASEEGVPRVVLLSTLDLMTPYDPTFTVGESWSPRPVPEPRVLARHLCEYTAREFAREGRVTIVTLRLGHVVKAEEVKDQPFDPLWLEERDMIQAVAGALEAKVDNPWSVFHIQAESPRARFTVARAKSALGYQPRYLGGSR
ncbi:MAG: NAD-dependent epimerase/dehydratase family protein [Bryobacteraceae bacterium]